MKPSIALMLLLFLAGPAAADVPVRAIAIDPRWLPDDVDNVSCLNFRAMQFSGIYQKLTQELGAAFSSPAERAYGGYFNIPSSEVYLLLRASSRDASVAIIHLRLATNAGDLVRRSGRDFDRENVGPYVLFVQKNTPAASFALLTNDMLLTGPRDAVKAILQRGGNARIAAEMRDALGKIGTHYVEASAALVYSRDETAPIYRCTYTDAGNLLIRGWEITAYASQPAAEIARKRFEQAKGNVPFGEVQVGQVGASVFRTTTFTFEDLKKAFENMPR
jgi:hypothetical protein